MPCIARQDGIAPLFEQFKTGARDEPSDFGPRVHEFVMVSAQEMAADEINPTESVGEMKADECSARLQDSRNFAQARIFVTVQFSDVLKNAYRGDCVKRSVRERERHGVVGLAQNGRIALLGTHTMKSSSIE